MEFDPEPIAVETKDIFEPRVVHEPSLETKVLLSEHLNFDIEHSEVVTEISQSSVVPETPSLTSKGFFRLDSEILPPGLIVVEEEAEEESTPGTPHHFGPGLYLYSESLPCFDVASEIPLDSLGQLLG